LDGVYSWQRFTCVYACVCICGDQAAQMGSEAQKDKYLPSLSKQQKVCAYVSQTINPVALWLI